MNINADPSYPVIDGFVLNTSLRCNLRFRSLAMQEYEAMRRAGNFRSKYWVISPTPLAIVYKNNQTENTLLLPYDSFEYAIPVVPGSVIWGFIWVNYLPLQLPGPFSFQVTESCTDVPFFSEVVRADNFLITDGIQPPPEQKFLPRPIVIPEPGLLNVQICSQQSSPVLGVGPGQAYSPIQLVLCGGEPARFA